MCLNWMTADGSDGLKEMPGERIGLKGMRLRTTSLPARHDQADGRDDEYGMVRANRREVARLDRRVQRGR